MKQKTLTLWKKMSIMVLTLMMAFFALSGIGKAGKVLAATPTLSGSGTPSSPYTYTFTDLDEGANTFTVNVGSGTSSKIVVVFNISKEGDIVFPNQYGLGEYNIERTAHLMAGEAQSFDFDKSAFSGKTITITFTLHDSQNNGGISTDSAKPTVVALPSNDTTTNLSWTQTATGGSKNKVYYKLEVAEKTYYHFSQASSVVGILYKGDSVTGEVVANSITLFNINDEHLLDKGTYLLEMYSSKTGEQCSVDIKSRDFKDIKKITVQEKFEVYRGSKTPITLTFDPADNESSIKWTNQNEDCMEIRNYDTDSKDWLSNDKAIIYANSLGTYTGTITTSEGISKTITVMVKPNPTKVSAATSTTSSKKKASVVLEWSGDGNYYKVYEKSGNDYKVVKETTDSKVTLSKTPGKTYNYKIESCYKSGGQIVCSSMGDGVDVITAPYKVPTIKSMKQSGSTKYVKPYTKTEKHWNGKYYYYETHKYGNSSNAYVKIKYTKAKGSKYTAANKGATLFKANSWVLSGNKLYFGYSGKIKAKTERIKLRGVWVKGNSVAYGPWSKVKTVKIKAAK